MIVKLIRKKKEKSVYFPCVSSVVIESGVISVSTSTNTHFTEEMTPDTRLEFISEIPGNKMW